MIKKIQFFRTFSVMNSDLAHRLAFGTTNSLFYSAHSSAFMFVLDEGKKKNLQNKKKKISFYFIITKQKRGRSSRLATDETEEVGSDQKQSSNRDIKEKTHTQAVFFPTI